MHFCEQKPSEMKLKKIKIYLFRLGAAAAAAIQAHAIEHVLLPIAALAKDCDS